MYTTHVTNKTLNLVKGWEHRRLSFLESTPLKIECVSLCAPPGYYYIIYIYIENSLLYNIYICCVILYIHLIDPLGYWNQNDPCSLGLSCRLEKQTAVAYQVSWWTFSSHSTDLRPEVKQLVGYSMIQPKHKRNCFLFFWIGPLLEGTVPVIISEVTWIKMYMGAIAFFLWKKHICSMHCINHGFSFSHCRSCTVHRIHLEPLAAPINPSHPHTCHGQKMVKCDMAIHPMMRIRIDLIVGAWISIQFMAWWPSWNMGRSFNFWS
jgi:hypothetical protein